MLKILGNPSENTIAKWSPALDVVARRMSDDANPMTVEYLNGDKIKIHWCDEKQAKKNACMIDTFKSPEDMLKILINPF